MHYSNIKSKQVTRSDLALKVYKIIRGVNIAIASNITIKIVIN